jgi:hypothetical protein
MDRTISRKHSSSATTALRLKRLANWMFEASVLIAALPFVESIYLNAHPSTSHLVLVVTVALLAFLAGSRLDAWACRVRREHRLVETWTAPAPKRSGTRLQRLAHLPRCRRQFSRVVAWSYRKPHFEDMKSKARATSWWRSRCSRSLVLRVATGVKGRNVPLGALGSLSRRAAPPHNVDRCPFKPERNHQCCTITTLRRRMFT